MTADHQSTSTTNRLQAAGFRFLPVDVTTKAPLAGRGIDSAQSSIGTINPAAYGIVPPLGYVVLDFDTKGGRDGWAEFRAKYDEPPQGWVVRTPSGGRHVYLRVPAELGAVGNRPIIKDAVDVRGQRGYVLGPGCPGYVLEDEDTAEIPEAPDWLFGLLTFTRASSVPSHMPAPVRVVRPEPLDPSEWRDIIAALAHVPSDDYHTWVRVGHALAMAAPAERAYDVWAEWSAKSAKFDEDATRSKWRELLRSASGTLTHRTIYRMGMECGWPNSGGRSHEEPPPYEEVEPDADGDEGMLDALAEASAPSDAFPWGEIPIEGPLLDAIEWVEACNPRELRVAALVGAMAGMGSVLARRVYVQWAPGADAAPMPVQQPMVVVARSGGGKGAPLECAKTMSELGGRLPLRNLPFHHITLHAELVQHGGVLVLMLDELDGALSALDGKSAVASEMEGVVKTLLSGNSHLAPPSAAVHNSQRVAVDLQWGEGTWAKGVSRPSLVLFGVATRNVLDKLAGNVAGGLVGRLLVFDLHGDITPPRRPKGNPGSPPQAVRDWISWFYTAPKEGSFQIPVEVPPLVLDPDPEAVDELERVAIEFTGRSNAAADAGSNHLADIMARAIEAVAKVASDLAIMGSPEPTKAQIGVRHVRGARAMVLWCHTRTAFETEQREETVGLAKVTHRIRARLAASKPTPWIYRSLLTRGIEVQSKLVLDALLKSGEVVSVGVKYALRSRLPR